MVKTQGENCCPQAGKRILTRHRTCRCFDLGLSSVQHDTHSLCLDLTVKSQSGPGHPWYEVQASVDKKPVFQYDSDSSKMKPLGLLGAKVNATKAWTELTQMLGEVGQELRMIVSDIKLENSVTSGPPTLHIQLSCQCEAEQGTVASWHFNINGQPALLFDTMNMTWTVTSPGARGVKEEWENKGLADYFRRISMGDCRHWLREFLEHWEKVPEPPVPPKKVPDADQSLPMPSIACIILGVIVISPVIIVICFSISRKLAQRSPKKPKEALYQEARLSSPALLSI
ncbi:retinoic acid early transcript 1E-like isoform X2 [Neofelis nebulosa]|uniref:retinoic acid early transcript 1E-like isoform X2 n=1 Tax=Neofelis nebulosa TaxID=61452 RepID=UPI00272DA6C4|nr:retinoic acid early transcript 1E-like isoform X2 [Neofelis nebulosa]